ncbi:MAG: glutathione S-transferase [Sphingomonadales bacterium BRH_c3]|nr:MAG: glutathione S-transferase [Sphingomonadales bacterium BRH_c3]
MPNILYGAPLSLFSGKARAYFDWKGVEYEERLPTPDVYRDVILPNIGRPVIPVVQTSGGEILQDTTCIIDHFERAEPGPSVYPETPRQRLAALLLECFGDEWLVIPAMHYRWHYNEDFAYSEFGKTAAPGASAEEQYRLGKERAGPFRGSLPILGVNDETVPAIEAGYEALLADLDSHFAEHAFLFGTRPSIGDYGLIGPLYAHLYRDPASGEIMERLAPRVAKWVRRMVNVEAPQSGEFLPNDEVPETLHPVLRRMMEEQVPHLQGVARMLGEWARQNEGNEPPRGLGMADFAIEGIGSQRMAFPFSLWMLQRGLDYLASLSGADRAACEALLRQVGGEALLNFDLPLRLTFENHRLGIAR